MGIGHEKLDEPMEMLREPKSFKNPAKVSLYFSSMKSLLYYFIFILLELRMNSVEFWIEIRY